MLRQVPFRCSHLLRSQDLHFRSAFLHIQHLCTTSKNQVASPTASDGAGDNEAAGRDLAKLSKLAGMLREAIEERARKGLTSPEILVTVEQDVVESYDLIKQALDKAGRPCTVDELADRINRNIISFPPEALGYKELLRANLLRDTIEGTLVMLQIKPPDEAMLDTAGKLFDRRDRKAQRQKMLQLEEDRQPRDPTATIEVKAQDDVLKELRPVSEVELARRKAYMENMTSMETVLTGFDTALLEVGRVNKVVKGGTTMSMRALVVVGNRNGTAGYGEGKSDTPQHAVERACRDAKRNLLHIDLHQGRTIFHRVTGSYVKSRVTIRPAPRGTGISANNNFLAIFQLFGLKDIGAKLHGPRSLSNAVKALFNGLSEVQSPQKIAAVRGLAEIIRPPRVEFAPGVRRRKLKHV